MPNLRAISFTPRVPKSLIVRYGAAILSVVAALALRLLAWPIFQAEAPFLFFMVAVVFSAWGGGLGPGLLATFLGCLLADYFLLPPYHQFGPAKLSQFVWLDTFFLLGVFVSYLLQDLHVAIRRSEETGRIAEKRAAESEEAKKRQDEFLAMLSHELRNPLYAIMNAATLLKSNNLPEPIAQRAGKIIERRIQDMARLLDSLLDASRFVRGKIELQTERVDLNTIIGVSVESCRPVIESRRQDITVSPVSEPLPVEADPVRLEQVFTNLLSNAAKYTKVGGHIWITVTRDEGEAIVLVRDNGIGIAPELLPRIFDIFVQGEQSVDRPEGGLGVGLTLVRALVELHHGRVEAYSDGLGQGSQFIVRLPLHLERQETTETSAAKVGRAVSGAKILLVEDSIDSAELLEFLLKAEGYNIRLAHDGKAAITTAADFFPDLMVLDIGLPGMNGYEVAEYFRKSQRLSKIPLIALTGYGREEDRERSAQAGFCRHLTKPVDIDELRRALAECLTPKGANPA